MPDFTTGSPNAKLVILQAGRIWIYCNILTLHNGCHSIQLVVLMGFIFLWFSFGGCPFPVVGSHAVPTPICFLVLTQRDLEPEYHPIENSNE